MREELLEIALERDELADLDPAERRLALRQLLLEKELDVGTSLPEIARAIDGFGPLHPLMEDDEVTDVLVNGTDEVWIERAGRLLPTSVRFADEAELRSFVERMLAPTGARADSSHPVADARLSDGSRIHVVLPPVASGLPLVSIRKFPPVPLSLEDLAARGMLAFGEVGRLRTAVRSRQTIAIGGGTGTGKTTLLNALLGEIGSEERVVVLEETAELRPRCPHFVALLTRDSNLEGSGAVGLTSLVRAALRMRPDRIVIGEVRGGEVLAALAAMSVGHAGSMVTVHARSASEMAGRLVTLGLMAGSGASEATLARQVETVFDLFVYLDRGRDGGRRVAEILERERRAR